MEPTCVDLCRRGTVCRRSDLAENRDTALNMKKPKFERRRHWLTRARCGQTIGQQTVCTDEFTHANRRILINSPGILNANLIENCSQILPFHKHQRPMSCTQKI